MSLIEYIVNNLHKIDLKFDEDYIDIDKDTILEYGLSSISYFRSTLDDNGNTKYKINFVGIIINRKTGSILISLPKQFISKEKFMGDPAKYIKLLMKIFLHYKKRNYNKIRYRLNDNGIIHSNYPFQAFSNIYKYYYKYGIFKAVKNSTSTHKHKHFLWNMIIKKSHKIIDDRNNLIFNPLFSRSNKNVFNFISKYMIFAINHTINVWQGIKQDLPNKINTPLWLKIKQPNTKFAISKLRIAELHTFKDNDKFLIINLIHFFKHLNNKHKQVFTIICPKYWPIWEDMMKEYLDYHFNGIKPSSHLENNIMLKFTTKIKNNNFQKPSFNYNTLDKNRNSHLYFQPDHYLQSPNHSITYLFDSKYYKNIKRTDYKQVLYEFLLSKINKKRRIFNILFIPSWPTSVINMKAHPFFILKNKFNPIHKIIKKNGKNKIKKRRISVYICPMDSMQVAKSYINKDG